jgi:hypothetical protein
LNGLGQCNRLASVGVLESTSGAKADFIAMHPERHLCFTIDRRGRLKSEWDGCYQNVLVPLEITSGVIQNGETIVFTREGRVIGGLEAFERVAAGKYEVQIECDDDWIDDISRTHVNRAQEVIDDSDADALETKIGLVLKRRTDQPD